MAEKKSIGTFLIEIYLFALSVLNLSRVIFGVVFTGVYEFFGYTSLYIVLISSGVMFLAASKISSHDHLMRKLAILSCIGFLLEICIDQMRNLQDLRLDMMAFYIIIFGAPIFYLTRPKVKERFTK